MEEDDEIDDTSLEPLSLAAPTAADAAATARAFAAAAVGDRLAVWVVPRRAWYGATVAGARDTVGARDRTRRELLVRFDDGGEEWALPDGAPPG